MTETTQARTRKPWGRGRKIGAALLGFTLATGGGALAAILAANISGSITVKGQGVEVTAAALTGTSDASCPTASVVGAAMSITPSAGMVPGVLCEYDVSLRAVGSNATFTGLTGTLPAGSGLTFSVPVGTALDCGDASRTVNTSGTPTKLRIAVPDAATAGGTFALAGGSPAFAVATGTSDTTCHASITAA